MNECVRLLFFPNPAWRDKTKRKSGFLLCAVARLLPARAAQGSSL